MMDTCVKHKGKCCHAVLRENGNGQWICHSQKTGTDWNSICDIIFWRQMITGWSSSCLLWDLANRWGWNQSRCHLFLICFQCQQAFLIHNLLPSTVLANAAIWWQLDYVNSIIPNSFLGSCSLSEKYHWSVCQGMQFLF